MISYVSHVEKKAANHRRYMCRVSITGCFGQTKEHFGSVAWEFECDHVKEIFLESKGVVINCDINNRQCCVDDGRGYFVNSPRISPLKNFLEASMKFLNR